MGICCLVLVHFLSRFVWFSLLPYGDVYLVGHLGPLACRRSRPVTTVNIIELNASLSKRYYLMLLGVKVIVLQLL